ncbi:TetR/AcrR family transcriptional regulator [Carboxylicivirga sp. N1Y90]|uniref:TetR/AcrR family transcriptional regulator n=1 Tax=Carboxylicivirga fragile TaxID=3417571 RepID=UPI003D3307E0|nr:TetR/AcrR family transcriptional regulator [Marinilabiliaceae bacterium N1Y90]
MCTPETYSIWLEAAYCLFAEKGPENFSIKEVAKKCGLPRTNFYYYFDSKDDLLDKIIDLHFQSTAEIFNVELSKSLNVFIPDLYEQIYAFKLGIQFAKNLFKHRDISRYNEAHIKGVALSADLIIPKFKAYFNINLPDDQVKQLWFTLTDTWYSRLSFNNYSVDYLCELCHEIMASILPLIELANKKDNKLRFVDTPV